MIQSWSKVDMKLVWQFYYCIEFLLLSAFLKICFLLFFTIVLSRNYLLLFPGKQYNYRSYIWVFNYFCVHPDTITLMTYNPNLYSSCSKRLFWYGRFSETFLVTFISLHASICCSGVSVIPTHEILDSQQQSMKQLQKGRVLEILCDNCYSPVSHKTTYHISFVPPIASAEIYKPYSPEEIMLYQLVL